MWAISNSAPLDPSKSHQRNWLRSRGDRAGKVPGQLAAGAACETISFCPKRVLKADDSVAGLIYKNCAKLTRIKFKRVEKIECRDDGMSARWRREKWVMISEVIYETAKIVWKPLTRRRIRSGETWSWRNGCQHLSLFPIQVMHTSIIFVRVLVKAGEDAYLVPWAIIDIHTVMGETAQSW